MVFWGRSVLGCPKGSAEGSTPRFVKFRGVSGLLGQIGLGLPQGWKVGQGSTKVSPRFHQGFIRHSKGLGAKWRVCLLGSLQQMTFASQKVLWSVPQTVLYIGLTVLPGFLGKWLLLHKRFCGGFANCALHLSPSLLLQSKLSELLTWLTYTNPVHRKRPIMLLLLGYSLGIFLLEAWIVIFVYINHSIIFFKVLNMH